MVFVRRSLASSVSAVDTAHVTTGIGDVVGNKGGVGVSFRMCGTSFLFINSHFAAHQDAVRYTLLLSVVCWLRLFVLHLCLLFVSVLICDALQVLDRNRDFWRINTEMDLPSNSDPSTRRNFVSLVLFCAPPVLFPVFFFLQSAGLNLLLLLLLLCCRDVFGVNSAFAFPINLTSILPVRIVCVCVFSAICFRSV